VTATLVPTRPSADATPLSAEVTPDPTRDSALPDRFDALYGEHFEFVWRSLRRLGVRPEDLDDAAQDVFIVFLRRCAEFRRESSCRTWLFGIASNVAHQYRRKAQRQAQTLPVTDSERTPHPSPLDQASSTQALRVIDAFLASLDDSKRDVFILAELEQLSAPEIAEALGVKLNTVYSRLRAARQAFHALLSQHAGSEP
jgi:RNA polymerase sigma-70 factor, ECF subfamily